jgi:hypothetical protein
MADIICPECRAAFHAADDGVAEKLRSEHIQKEHTAAPVDEKTLNYISELESKVEELTAENSKLNEKKGKK